MKKIVQRAKTFEAQKETYVVHKSIEPNGYILFSLKKKYKGVKYLSITPLSSSILEKIINNLMYGHDWE